MNCKCVSKKRYKSNPRQIRKLFNYTYLQVSAIHVCKHDDFVSAIHVCKHDGFVSAIHVCKHDGFVSAIHVCKQDSFVSSNGCDTSAHTTIILRPFVSKQI